MNAIVEPAFGVAAIEQIIPAIYQPRRRMDEKTLADLTESVKRHGILQAILTRPHPDTENHPECLEIVAGERRYRAAIAAGLKSIPVLVKDMTDREMREIQLIENLQREDVHQIEEAEGFQNLMDEFQMNVDQVAESVGKSRSYIYGRLKLLALSPEIRDQVFNGDIDISTALLIARIPVPALQVRAAAEIMAGGVHWNGVLRTNTEPFSYRAARDHLQSRFMLQLESAKFNIQNIELLPAAGSCTDCPKRSGNQPEVFPDISADVCTDPDCYAAKNTAHDDHILAEAKKSDIPLYEGDEAEEVYCNGDYSTLSDSAQEFDGIKEDHEYEELGSLLKPDQLPPPVAYAAIESGVEPLYDKTAMRDALERAGLMMSEEESAKLNTEHDIEQKEKAKTKKVLDEQKKKLATQHTLFRAEVFDAIRQQPFATVNRPILMLTIDFIFKRYGSHSFWTRQGMQHASEEDKALHLEQQTDSILLLLIMEAIVHQQLHANEWSIDDKLKIAEPAQLLSLATACGIDVASIKERHLPTDVPTKPAKKAKAPIAKAEATEALTAEPKAPKKSKKKESAVSEPAPAQESVTIRLDDVVKVSEDARGANNKKRKVAGKVGVVTGIQDDYYMVKFGPRSHELVTNLTLAELEKTDEDKPQWFVDLKAAWPFPTGAV